MATRVGLVETSIGKMVPLIPEAQRNRDPLTVYADPRAAILSVELAALYAVQNGVLSVEPD